MRPHDAPIRLYGLLLCAQAVLLAGVLLSSCGGGGSGSVETAAAASTASAALAAAADTATLETADALPRPALSPRAQLGQQIFNDPNLSEPRGTACVACHQPTQGFAGNNGSTLGVALGSRPGTLGLRNALTNAYAAQTPPFGFVTPPGRGLTARGGLFWDGRADTLALQAPQPLLNPLEMNNPSPAAVAAKIAAAAYAPAFAQEFGSLATGNPDQVLANVALALQAFEQSSALQPLSSKYDAVVTGRAAFTAAEQRGLAVFRNPQRANCAGCHHLDPASGNPADSPFTDVTYLATGIPRNNAIPANADPAFFDLGLCGPSRTTPTPPPGVAPASLCGKFRMPTLRNVAKRQRFMHNGFFSDLREVANFYATRAVDPQRWYGPSGLPNDLPPAYLANLETQVPPFNRRPGQPPAMTPTEIDDLLAFLATLSDGYAPP